MKKLAVLTAAVMIFGCGGKKNKDKKQTAKPAPTAKPTAKDPAAGLQGQAMADSIMAQWQRAHPDRDWEAEVRRSHPNIPSSADNSAIVGVEKKKRKGQDQTYGRYTAKDIQVWKRETEKIVLAGARIFHSADELGSTNAVSCDMCHPDAANTHPETYPKFQVQMGRVALLRDMINWCLINPLRAKAMKADDFRMRAVEAYILAQRKGKALEFGKH